MTLGMTNGTSNGGLFSFVGNTGVRVTNVYSDAYGDPVSAANYNVTGGVAGSIGVTTDATKSGIVADISALPTFDPYFYIKY